MAGLYIHIPFCRSKCAYCDFYSTAAKGSLDTLVEAELRELDIRKNELGSRKVETIYLGGGTPSLLPLPLLAKLVEGIKNRIDTSAVREFTIEANPEDITHDYIAAVKHLGINRISIGVQSFNNSMLKAIGRNHRAEDAESALQALKEAGINFNADLIYGLPDQTSGQWTDDLEHLLSFEPPHLSAYLLSYEPGTRLYAMQMKGIVEPASAEVAGQMYQLLCELASQKGYRHYEISNFALPGAEAAHNSAYWDYTPYLGIGPAAHSFTQGIRRYNPSNIRSYITGISDGKKVAAEEEETDDNKLNDYIITSLRTSRGIELDKITALFPPALADEFHRNVEECRRLFPDALESTSSGFRIDERQWLISDAIMRELIVSHDDTAYSAE